MAIFTAIAAVVGTVVSAIAGGKSNEQKGDNQREAIRANRDAAAVQGLNNKINFLSADAVNDSKLVQNVLIIIVIATAFVLWYNRKNE